MSLFSIPAHLPFAPALARHVLGEFGQDPAALSRLTLLLPTRRAVLTMRQAFLEAAPGRALLLPSMSALGDVGEGETADELSPGGVLGHVPLDEPPAISGLERQALLTMLVHQRLDQDVPVGGPPVLEQAALLADELGRLIDRVQTAGLDFSALSRLRPEDRNLAAHWEDSVTFLEIVTRNWPELLEERGLQDAARRRHRLMMALAESWRENPPQGAVIAAGSTGSIPATRALLSIIAGLPEGRVVLPGLDLQADAEEWEAIAGDPTHPQFGIAELLAAIGRDRDEVAVIGDGEVPPRQQLLSLAMRPAAVSDVWAGGISGLSGAEQSVLRIDCDHPGEEAAVIAIILREALESEAGIAALVTPDRDLARRTVALLRRWGIDIDDSAGTELADTPAGAFLRLVARAATTPDDPVALLSLLKHPMARAGLAAAEFGEGVRAFDLLLRRDVSGASWAELQRMGTPWSRAVLAALQPLTEPAGEKFDGLEDLLEAHSAAAEALAASDTESGSARLWAGEDGEAAAEFIDQFRQSLVHLRAAKSESYGGFFETMMRGRPVRSRRPGHSRLVLLGPLEARLQAPDRVILAGLNEGTWPRDAAPDPWMSHGMQIDFGLPAPERVVGLAAHDFVQSFASAEVFLTRSRRVEGTPARPSRFLERLEAAMAGCGLELAKDKAADYLRLARALDRVPDHEARAEPPPAPSPPVAARPARLSQSAVAQLMRDPYGFYARYVLRLRVLDPVTRAPEARDRGEVLHTVLARVLPELGRRPMDQEAARRLVHEVERELARLGDHEQIRTFWQRRLERAIDWLVHHESTERDPDWRWTHLEHTIEGSMEAAGRRFELTAKADRIDRHPTLGLAVIDYKTGGVPSGKDVKAGIEPQLPMEALLIADFGTESLRGPPVGSLEYWKMSGGRDPGETKCHSGVDSLVEDARSGLDRLLTWLGDEETVFLSRVRPKSADRPGDYDHLARVGEWSPGDRRDGS